MTTKAEYIKQARAANPQPQYWVAGEEQIMLTDEEYEASIEAWADMRVEQDAQTAADKAARDAAIAHAKSLGFTDEMIAVMYPSLGATDA